MLRVAVFLLLAANLVFFGWARGWFEPGWPAPRQGEREPQRLAAQLRPDAVTVLPGKAASAAIAAARAASSVCLQAGPLSEGEMAAAVAAIAAVQLPDGSWTRETVPPPPLWLVFAGRWPDPAGRKARQAELDRLGLAWEPLDAPPELAPGLVLSRHATRAEADAAFAALSAKLPALKSIRVAPLPSPPPRSWLRVPKADVDQQARLLALPPAALGGGFKPCAAPA